MRCICWSISASPSWSCGRRTYAERLTLALELLADPRFDALCAPVARFADLPAALPALLAPGAAAPPCPVITYP